MTAIRRPSALFLGTQFVLGLFIFNLIGCTGAPNRVYGTYSGGPQLSGTPAVPVIGGQNGGQTGIVTPQAFNPFDPFGDGGGGMGEMPFVGPGGGNYVALNAQRCEELGEVSLGPTQYMGRVQWAQKCDLNSTDQQMINAALNATFQGGNMMLYPMYGTLTQNGSPTVPKPPGPVSVTPPPPGGSCTGAYAMPSNYVLLAFCAAGCFEPKQRISVASQANLPFSSNVNGVPIASLDPKSENTYVFNLDGSSKLSDIKLKSSRVGKFIGFTNSKLAKADHAQEFITFTTKSGKSVTVTNTHAMITGEGYLETAAVLTESFAKSKDQTSSGWYKQCLSWADADAKAVKGNNPFVHLVSPGSSVVPSLITDNGSIDPIASVQCSHEKELAYNFDVAGGEYGSTGSTSDILAHIIDANGILTGDHALQTSLGVTSQGPDGKIQYSLPDLNRQLLERQLIPSTIVAK